MAVTRMAVTARVACTMRTPPMSVLYWYTAPVSSADSLSPLYHCGRPPAGDSALENASWRGHAV